MLCAYLVAARPVSLRQSRTARSTNESAEEQIESTQDVETVAIMESKVEEQRGAKYGT